MQLGDTYKLPFTVTEKIYQNFIDSYGDNNPLHTNEVFAKEKGFVSKVMHGNILGGFLSYFIGECLPTKDVIIHSLSIEYKHPVYMNDRLSLSCTLDELFESVNVYIFKYYFENESGVKVAKGKIQIGLLK